MSFEQEPVEPASGHAPAFNICPGCRAEMPREMRFCRLCGYRLGEGVAEYAETVRFGQQPSDTGPKSRTATASAQPQPTATLNNGLWGAPDQDKGRTSLAAQPARVP
ncbi:MAG TPA: hypothetical protein VGB17_14405, partial [Pyrinomonadaceae bacterium]